MNDEFSVFRNVNGSIWSNHSVLTFDSFDTFANCSAQEVVSFFTVQNAVSIFAQGDDTNVSFPFSSTPMIFIKTKPHASAL